MSRTDSCSLLDAPADNIFESDPGYDEAYGPRNPHHFLLGENTFVPIDDVSEEDAPNRFVIAAAEDAQDRENRLFYQDPNEPLGRGETEADVRAALEAERPYIYFRGPMPICSVAPIAARRFKVEEVLSAKAGVVKVAIRKFDKTKKRFIRTETSVVVAVCGRHH